MALSVPIYAIFLAFVAVTLTLAPTRFRVPLLLIANGYLYLGFGSGWPAILWVIAFGYGGGILLSITPERRGRGIVLVAIIFVLLAPFLFFKYNLSFLPFIHNELSPLPIGISFFSFAACGYLIDVFIGTASAEKSPAKFAAFVSFFPTVSAGPIERKERFMRQLGELGKPSRELLRSGFRMILVGAFLKLVIANSLAPQVDAVYGAPASHSSADLILATVYFAFQVYADFAGYSLIAIGSAAILGIRLMPNFQQPYLSQTVSEFWRRWHISMSSWFRDYVFTPLQLRLRRSGMYGFSIAMVSTFIAVGIWHGTGWKFVAFGLIHGVAATFSTFSLKWRSKLLAAIGIPQWTIAIWRTVATFLFVCATLVLFRASSLGEALTIYSRIAELSWGRVTLPVLLPSLTIGCVIIGDLVAEYAKPYVVVPVWIRWAIYYVAVVLIVVAHVQQSLQNGNYGQQFIYFKF